MYSKDMLVGIFLGTAKTEIYLEKNEHSQIGYRVRLRVNLRANEDFLVGVQRSLAQLQITSRYKESEHKGRQRPILRVGGIKNLYKLCGFIPPNLPDANNDWSKFREAVSIVSNGGHLQLEGLERLFELKGLI
jgi:hypothetical protein